VLITVRKQDRDSFLESLDGMPEWLETHGYTPEACEPKAQGTGGTPTCRYHGAQKMTPSKFGEGRFVCSIKLEDGSYCNHGWPAKAKSDH
jgi:hypothetical protein